VAARSSSPDTTRALLLPPAVALWGAPRCAPCPGRTSRGSGQGRRREGLDAARRTKHTMPGDFHHMAFSGARAVRPRPVGACETPCAWTRTYARKLDVWHRNKQRPALFCSPLPLRFRAKSHLERRPSSLGLDHGWCVYSKPGEPCRVQPPYLKEPKRQFLCSHTKKHDNGVHIIPPVFTSFLSPLDYTCSSKGVYTHTSTLGHTVMPLHATHHR
jgi:hypothetical protein